MPASPRIRIAFLTAADAHDRRSWSGLHYMFSRSLQKHAGEVSYLGPVSLRYLFGLGDRLNRLVGWLSKGRRYHYSISILTAQLYGAIFARKLRRGQYDVIFAPAGYTEVAYLRTDLPIVCCCDSTITQLIGYYAGLSALLPVSKRELTYIEQRAIDRADLLIYASHWAGSSAVRDFGAAPDKVAVVPFGANFPVVPPRAEALAHAPQLGRCRLLFVGVEWGRKGGQIALDALAALQARGIAAELTICGCVPPPDTALPPEGLTVISFLDKNDPAQLARLVALYREADFFLLPTRAECAGIVFCEASSFGLPSFTTDTGGIADFVEDGVNGYRLSLVAGGEDFAAAIAAVLADPARYQQLRRTARDLYEQRLNWDAWGQTVANLLAERFGTQS